MATKQISSAEAVKAFKAQSILVQTSRPAKVTGADGKVRDGLKVENKPLAEEHVLAAYDYGDRVVMTTSDGRKLQVSRGAAA